MNIQSERLQFRFYTDEDFNFLASMTADPKMMRFIGDGKTRNREGALRFLYWIYRGYEENPELGLRLLVRKSDGKRLGHAGIVPQIVEGVEETEIGYWIFPDFWGQGYATEAAKALAEYGFTTLRKHRLVSLIQRGNEASRKVAEKIGMELEKESWISGQLVCVYVLEKKKEEM
ncbi:GNAT family N-acetyltransferase [Planococcus salinus]|uniref:N-acetyltransferase n=1 Tax=Planococcus salinus TaxID=1848460 RepID=A0A3M8P953_9BACL|nr:GNAT family N-acetyltransferase [Planococcus salinus]RNF39961.1 N-acetyltransferase [Planococcus salinus]